MADFSPNDHKFRINQQPKFTPSPHANRDKSYGGDLIGQIHQVVHKTRSKISNLKQEVASKDQEVKRERAMRKAAERRDQEKSMEGTYIDPYAGSSPSVSEELKQWLSPAAQRKRLMGRGNSPPERKDRTPTRSRQKQHQGDEAEGQEQVTAESYNSSEDDRMTEERRSKRRGRSRKGYDEADWDESSSYSRRRHHQPQSWYGEYSHPPPPHHPAYIAPNPWISQHRVPPIPLYDPRLLHTIGPEYPSYPIPQHATSTPEHQRRHSSGEPNRPFTVPTLVIPTQPPKESGQGDHARSSGDGVKLQHSNHQTSTSTPQQIPVTIQIQQSPNSTQQDRSPQPFTSMTESATKGESRLNTSDRSESTVNTGVGTSPLQMPMNRPFDERGLPMLLEELGVTKDKNKVLSEKCSEAKLEIESLKMQLGVKDAMSEAELAAKGAALIEEIYTAQREHDEAIMARLQLANDERDDAFARLQKSKDGFDSGTDVNSNEEDNTQVNSSLNNLLTRLTVADNRSSINKYGSAIIGRISKTKGRKDEITSEEMRAILKEKDIAVAKCKKLEREVIELRRNKETSKSRNNNEKSLKAQLEITRDERDKALVAAKKLKDEIDSLKVYYSLHKSLSQEANLRDQFNNTLGSIEEQVKTRDEVLARTQQNNSQLAQQVRAANDERNKMVVQLQRYEQENQHLKSKAQQLERLVGVLRKKVTEGTVKTV